MIWTRIVEEWSLKKSDSSSTDEKKKRGGDDGPLGFGQSSGMNMDSLTNLLNLESSLDKLSNLTRSDLFETKPKTFGGGVHSDFVYQMVESADPTTLKHGKKYGFGVRRTPKKRFEKEQRQEEKRKQSEHLFRQAHCEESAIRKAKMIEMCIM